METLLLAQPTKPPPQLPTPAPDRGHKSNLPKAPEAGQRRRVMLEEARGTKRVSCVLWLLAGGQAACSQRAQRGKPPTEHGYGTDAESDGLALGAHRFGQRCTEHSRGQGYVSSRWCRDDGMCTRKEAAPLHHLVPKNQHKTDQ